MWTGPNDAPLNSKHERMEKLKMMVSPKMNWLARLIIWQAKKTPYTHLEHADGTLYMGRWWLFQTRWLSCRVHHIASADYDRHFHDHPFSFVSVLLHGWYVEKRPVAIDPCFFGDEDSEEAFEARRTAGSIALRRTTDRHLISEVNPGGTWTLVFLSPRRQWWGFYTPAGKIHWRDYCSVHTPK